MSTRVKYLVTGGAGFIGSNLVAALVAAGERVRVLDDASTGHWENLDGIEAQSKIERLNGDVRDAEVVARACDGVEVCFHQAALGSVPKSVEFPIESSSVNVGGTVTLLDVARHRGVRRVIFAASSSAYGETPELPKHERLPATPLSPYAVSKFAGELNLRVFAEVYGLETLSLRYFNVFGPNQTPDGAYAAAVPCFVQRALTGAPVEIYGDGLQTRDFSFVKNTVRANLLAATTSRKLQGEVVNIAGARRVELLELVREIGRVLGREIAVIHTDPRPGDIRHSLGDVSLAAELLGFEPTVKWEEGLPSTVEYLSVLQTDGRSAASRVMAKLWS
jgi:nucleoside-diphosphate-sugar epimerase